MLPIIKSSYRIPSLTNNTDNNNLFDNFIIYKIILLLIIFSLLTACGGGVKSTIYQQITLESSLSFIEEDSTKIKIITLIVRSSKSSNEDTIVAFTTSGTAIDGTDYSEVNNTTLTIPAGSLTASKTFTIIDDAIYEGDETVTIAISEVSGGVIKGGIQSVLITIIDNELAPTIRLTSSTSSITEGSSESVRLTATSSQILNNDVIVTFRTSGTAIDGTDYSEVNNTTLTIPAGSLTASKTFTIIDDAIYEGDETVTIAISEVSGGVIEGGIQSVFITIIDNELASTIRLTSSASSITEGSSESVRLTATSSQISNNDVIVTFTTSGTAIDGTDYSEVNNTTLTIPAGSLAASKTFTIIDDLIYEKENDIVTIFISKLSEGNTTDNNNQSVSITIIDNEPLPMVSISINTESVYDYDPDVTITATSTIASQEDISVIVSTSGTATEGIDYGDISDITIVAGSTTGTSIFDPTKDTVNEGEEFAVISISSVLGADLSTSEATSVSIIIKEDALKTATLFTEGTALEQDAITRKRAWLNVNSRRNKNPDQDPNQPLNEYYVHPYEQMNVHKAQSFSNGGTKLRGKDKLIHIIDRGCDTRHAMFDNKIVHNLEEDGAFDNDGEVHCNAVSSLAAANGDGDTGIGGLITGVAPEAGLVLSRLASRREMAEDIDRAKELGAVVSSNSWGFTLPDGNGGMSDFNFKEFQDSRIAGKTNSESLVGLGDTAADVDKYIASLKNFQKTGVIVFAAGNGKDESDVNLAAAMPELFPELKGAWIVAGLVKFKGDSIDSAVESEFTLEGNKCGSSKEYCVVVDGMDIAAAGGVKDGNSGYIKASGSSFSAPMVSGGIALLSQAFPNHTPKQITARLLATANNKWFAAEGYTEFGKYGKGVRHGYHSTWGHGLPDFYAALRPVTSDTHPETMLYTGSSIQSSGDSGIALSSSSITPSSSFGDSIIQGLMGEVSYAYDALNSGFKYNMEERVDMSNNNAPTIDLTSELSKLGLNLNPAKLSWKDNFNKVLSKLSEMKKLRTSLTVGSSSLPVQSFFGSNFDSSINLNDYKTPYLESGEGGIGISAVYKLKNSRLLIGMTNPVDQNIDNTIGVRKTLVTSLEYGDPSNSAITIMSGITEDKDSLLGATGNNAYSFSGSRSDTSFIAFKTQIQLSKDLSLTSITTLANSDMTKPDSSFINSANNVKSTSVSVIANKRNIFGGGNMSFFVSQPNRVNSGDMSIKLSNLADSDGNLTYRNKNINLEPTARQLNYGLSYNKHLNENTSFLIKHMITNNLNHKKSSKKVNSSFIGVKYKHLKIGLVTNPSKNDKSAEALYNFKF